MPEDNIPLMILGGLLLAALAVLAVVDLYYHYRLEKDQVLIQSYQIQITNLVHDSEADRARVATASARATKGFAQSETSTTLSILSSNIPSNCSGAIAWGIQQAASF